LIILILFRELSPKTCHPESPSLRLAEGERGGPKARRSCAFWGAGVRERIRCSIRNHNKQIVAQLGMTDLSKWQI